MTEQLLTKRAVTERVLPDISEVVRCIARTLEDKIEPSLSTVADRSAIVTSKHLLRYVAARLETEGQSLLDETKVAAKLLTDATSFLDAEGKTVAAAKLAADIRAALAKKPDPAIYPTLAIMASEVGPLRGFIYRLLELLLALSDEARTPAAEALHEAVRVYIGWQLQQESKYLEEPFRGHGPRR